MQFERYAGLPALQQSTTGHPHEDDSLVLRPGSVVADLGENETGTRVKWGSVLGLHFSLGLVIPSHPMEAGRFQSQGRRFTLTAKHLGLRNRSIEAEKFLMCIEGNAGKPNVPRGVGSWWIVAKVRGRTSVAGPPFRSRLQGSSFDVYSHTVPEAG